MPGSADSEPRRVGASHLPFPGDHDRCPVVQGGYCYAPPALALITGLANAFNADSDCNFLVIQISGSATGGRHANSMSQRTALRASSSRGLGYAGSRQLRPLYGRMRAPLQLGDSLSRSPPRSRRIRLSATDRDFEDGCRSPPAAVLNDHHTVVRPYPPRRPLRGTCLVAASSR